MGVAMGGATLGEGSISYGHSSTDQVEVYLLKYVIKRGNSDETVGNTGLENENTQCKNVFLATVGALMGGVQFINGLTLTNEDVFLVWLPLTTNRVFIHSQLTLCSQKGKALKYHVTERLSHVILTCTRNISTGSRLEKVERAST